MKLKILAGALIVAFVTSSLNMYDFIKVPNYVRGIAALLFLISIVVIVLMLIGISTESSRERKQLMSNKPAAQAEIEAGDNVQNTNP